MPPIAAAIGSAADRTLLRCPEVNSRLISSPTTRKNRVSRPSLIQPTSGSENRASPKPSDTSISHSAVNPGPLGELLIATASPDASTNSPPAAGPQPPHFTARTPHPSPTEPPNPPTRHAPAHAPTPHPPLNTTPTPT